MINLIVHCPVKSDWDILVDIIYGLGYYMHDKGNYKMNWHDEKEHSCLRIDENGEVNYSAKRYYETDFDWCKMVGVTEAITILIGDV